MSDLKTLKLTRATVKTVTTKLMNKIKSHIEEDTSSENFDVLLEQLTHKINKLKELDSDILKLSDEKEIESEVITSEEYNEKLIEIKCQLQKKIREQNNSFHKSAKSDVKFSNQTTRDIENVNFNAISNVKLPKLSINKFYGDLSHWIEFYGQFENAIDKNPNLTAIEKFIYLQSLLGGPAFSAIAGFELTAENYAAALEVLKARFGQKNLLINSHIGILLNLKPIKTSNDTTALRKLLDKAEVQIRNLESLGIDSSSYGNLLTPILLKLIPHDLTLQFTKANKDNDWDLNSLLNFLRDELLSRERADNIHLSQPKVITFDSRAGVTSRSKASNPRSSTCEFMTSSVDNCLFCSQNHRSEYCTSLDVDRKREILKKQGRCFLCLFPKHRIAECKIKERCSYCNEKHSQAICYRRHKNNENKNESVNKAKKSEQNVKENVVSAISHCEKNPNTESSNNKSSSTLLQTCTARIKNPIDNKNEQIRILLDSASMKTFIHQDISRKLNLPILRTETLNIYAFGAKEASESTFNVVRLKLENRDEPSSNIEIEALETNEISAANIPTSDKYIKNKYSKLKGLQLADSYEFRQNKISLLIGVDFYYNIITGRIKRLNEKLVATETLFGWCLLGSIGSYNDLINMKIVVEERDISEQLKKFWELEHLGIKSQNDQPDNLDSEIMAEFESGITLNNNRYKVKLPWKQNMKDMLKNNREVAYRRFLKLRSTFQNDPSLFMEYKTIFDNYLKENIIEPIPVDNINECEINTFYLPHRAVIREDKTTSKIRIVFDASAHAKGELSLNDCLYTGLNLLPDLFCLLIKFRNYPIAITADIQQAFLQIELDEADREFTKFFWDENPFNEDDNKSLKVYRLTRVLFGVKSSPFLLAATIKYHLKKYIDEFPIACKLLNQYLYVDDFIISQPDVENAFKLSMECFNILKDANMTFRKWKTNSLELREKWKSQGIPLDETSVTPLGNHQNQNLTKILGVTWNPDNDTILFSTQCLEKFLAKKVNTKRYLLQTISRIFDPLGLLTPYTIRIKCLIQDIWCLGLDWDEPLPKDIEKIWDEWFHEIEELNNINVPRYYLAGVIPEVEYVELHSFSDASKKAYGASIYLRTVLKNKEIITSFVASKSRVAPLKTVSIPRLELLGALLAARLSKKIVEELDFPINTYFWTDSSITYYWIKGNPEKFKMFVRNRIMEIQNLSDPSFWFHCPGQDNPADLVTRGLSATELKNNHFWWHGPNWLKQDKTFWPKFEKSLDKLNVLTDTEKELKKDTIVKLTTTNEDHSQVNNDLIHRYSSFTKLIRISAWCLRFFNNCKLDSTNRKRDHLNSFELQNATKRLIKCIQLSVFQSEIKCLKKQQPLPKNNTILNLNPFLDKEELLRVGGRLKFSDLPESQKHQIILPKSHHFTDLLIKHFHEKSLHSGNVTTLSLIRQLYWIPSGKNQVRKVIHRCMTCFRTKNQTISQIMGELPRDRIIPTRPFEKTGLDFAGPIITKPNLKRSRVKLKSYIALFICFSTKATHLEVVSDLTTEAFLACLRRFIARRSRPSVIWSDNATNFKGACTLLKTFHNLCKSDPVQRFNADEGIQWNFIPPASPHFGGIWEANIKSMKNILLKVTKSVILNFEELTTLVSQIEAILNSRPLSPLSADSNDLQPLTPGHFLIGVPLLNIPETHTAVDFLSLSSRWAEIQQLRQKFWQRWSREYLNELQTRKKWKEPQPNLKEGQLVILKEVNQIPLKWTLARIIKVYEGADGRVRVTDVKTSNGTVYQRSITRIIPLPFDDSVGQVSNGGGYGQNCNSKPK